MHTLDFKEEKEKNKFTFCSGIPGDEVLASIKVWGVRVLGFLRTAMANGLRRSCREAARLKVAAVKTVK
jgi:hypothetical protein